GPARPPRARTSSARRPRAPCSSRGSSRTRALPRLQTGVVPGPNMPGIPGSRLPPIRGYQRPRTPEQCGALVADASCLPIVGILQRVALATESKAYEAFAERIGEYWDLYKIYWLLGWDQRTMMPPGGAAARADQLATVTRIMYERLTADEVGELLEELHDHQESLGYNSD